MIVTNIFYPGLKEELLYDLISIDQEFRKNGKSDENNHALLGAKKLFLFNQIEIVFQFKDATLFDLDILKELASDVKIGSVTYNPYPFSTLENVRVMRALQETQPDVYEHVMEMRSILLTVSEENKEEWKEIAPIGSFKYTGTAIYRGNNINSVFGGMVEDFIYKTYHSIDEIDQKDSELEKFLYTNFMDRFMTTYYNNSTKKGLIEDYLMKVKYFDYVDRYTDEKFNYSLAKITSGSVVANFLGGNQEELLPKIEKIKSMKNSSTDFYFVVSSDIVTYLSLKLLGNEPLSNGVVDIIASESYDQIYADSELKVKLSPRVLKTNGGRINIMITRNKSMKELITRDDSSQLKLFLPNNRYGLLLNYQRIKYLIRINRLVELDQEKIKDILSNDIFYRYVKLLSDIIYYKNNIDNSILTVSETN